MKLEKTVALAMGAFLMAAAYAPQIVDAHSVVGTHGKAKTNSKNQHQHVTVTIDGDGYHPALLNLKAGQQVHMTFVSKGDSCANDVSIPSLKKSLSLKPGQKKEVVFTPKKGQTIAFSCSMDMFKGKAVVK